MEIKPKTVLHAPQAQLSSQYLRTADTRRSEHIILEVFIKDSRGRVKRVVALVDCGATSIFVSPRLVEKLGLSTEKANIATLGIDGKVLESRDDSRKVELTAQYMSHRAPIIESDVLVVPIEAYDMVLGTPWFRDQKPVIDWTRGCVLGLLGSRGVVPRDAINVDGVGVDNQNSSDAEGSGHHGQIEVICATAFANLINGNNAEYYGLIEVSDGSLRAMRQQSGKRYLFHLGQPSPALR
jgi:hypothetical protein